jgi:enolase
MVELYKELVAKYDIIFIEDPLSEDDWDGFADITRELGGKYEVRPSGRGV